MAFYARCQDSCCWGNWRPGYPNIQSARPATNRQGFHPVHSRPGFDDSTDFAQARLTLQNTPEPTMHRYTAGTPCPAPSSASYPGNRYYDYGRPSSVYAPSYEEDGTTANIEFTTEIQAKPRTVKPRRPTRAARPATFNPSLDIFEDVAYEEEQQQRHAEVDTRRRSRATVMPEGARVKRSTLLAQPAQKIRRTAPSEPDAPVLKSHRKRVSQILMDRESPNVNATIKLQEDVLDKKELKKGPSKDLRRRTIYVPSDDTTYLTIHPGQSVHEPRKVRETSPDIGLDLVTVSDEDNTSLVSALKKEKKVLRKSLAAPPKRGPLSTSSRSLQSVSFSSDVTGSGDGKENVPPGMATIEKKSTGTHIEINFPKALTKSTTVVEPPKARVKSNSSDVTSVKSEVRSQVKSDVRTRPGGSAQKRLREQVSREHMPTSTKSIKSRADGTASAASSLAAHKAALKEHNAAIRNAKPRIKKTRPILPASSSPFHTDKTPPAALRRQKPERATAGIQMISVVGKPERKSREKYPVIEEDIARPEMYEDNWLTYQEVAITQLLNSMFDSANANPNDEQSPEELRKNMLALYHGPSMPPLHKRLQASLQFGALSIPKDLLAQTLRLKDDVGMRKKFLTLWTKSYDLTALRAAVEAIVGRQITTPSRLSTGSTSSDDGSRMFRAERRAIEHFLDAFLIKNEDAVRVKPGVGSIASITRGDDDFGSQGWSWRRTALRSLMLILLLDQAKKADILSGCLFQSTSAYKTSVDVLHQLSTMLLPSHGDITRPLGHLQYKVEHVQYPLQEYTYHIENIAIDLRDGIVLTRLVELLLYPSSKLDAQYDETVTISMPTGELLTSDMTHKDSWVLSQHLKYPAIGRPQKAYNVQVALSALEGVRGFLSQAAGAISASEIVDGHREKTLSLLWSLVGKYGLGSLVDWPHIVKETERFRVQWYTRHNKFEEDDLDSDSSSDSGAPQTSGPDKHTTLLLRWARAIARLHGLRVANLSTSFADPAVLESIVDTYLPPSLLPTTAHTSLVAKLAAVGCSPSFISLFMPQHASARSIPSKDFTLLTLSFLASRLLPMSAKHRAASKIQAQFRRHLMRRRVKERVRAMVLAHESAVVAKARQRVVDAAVVFQRRWRAVLDARQKKLERDVLAFQALARGWAIRRWVRRITAGRVGGKEKVRRARGGW
jgi:abnormal spindle-like microcephaly-associated protein